VAEKIMVKKRILIAVDGSAHSEAALRYVAQRLQTMPSTSVVVVNAQAEFMPSRYTALQNELLVDRRMRKSILKDYYKARSDEALKKPGIARLISQLSAKTVVVIGDPAEAIVGYAKRHRCDEIVMGTRGLGRVKGLLLGSIATRVVQLARMPVVLVK
jgi:nucleotide-binding universal stress UspA family protein